MRYTYEPRTEIRIKTLELANESEMLKMKILKHAQIEKYFNWSVLLTIITIILGVLNSPLLNP